MAYASWSVSFGEQPSAAKWNILGTNDAYFDSLVGSGTAWASGTPSATGFSSKTSDTLRYLQLGKIMHCQVNIQGTSNATTLTFTLPVAAKASDDVPGVRTANSGAFLNTQGLIQLTASSTTAAVFKDTSGAAFANTLVKGVTGYFFYETT